MMTSSTSTLSGLSESGESENGHQNRIRSEESQEDECPKCAAMKLNTIIAEEALASLSGQLKNLQKELKKTEQVSKINEEQARYIDERRTKLEKLEAERTALNADFECLRISHDTLKRQYNEVIATARKNQHLIEESAKYRETCKIAVNNLVAEKEARQELLSKYLKSVEAAAKINDAMKQVEKKCSQLQAMNEKLEPFRYHCPAMLRLLLEFGEIVENNGLMTKALQKRFSKYKDSVDLREYLFRKSGRLEKLSEMSTNTLEDSSEDDELAKGVEDLLMTLKSPSRSKTLKNVTSACEESDTASVEIKRQKIQPAKELKSTDINQQTYDSSAMKQSELVTNLPSASHEQQLELNLCRQTKTLRDKQLEFIEKQTQESLQKNEQKEKTMSDASDMGSCLPSTSISILNKVNNDGELIRSNSKDEKELKKSEQKPFGNRRSIANVSEAERDRGNMERNYTCKCDELRLKWIHFAHLDPLLPELCRPTFTVVENFETSDQHYAVGSIENLFGEPLSPSISSRRTSLSSTEYPAIPEARPRTKSGSSTGAALDSLMVDEEIKLFGGVLSPCSSVEDSTKNSTTVSATEPISQSFEISRPVCLGINSSPELVAVGPCQVNTEKVASTTMPEQEFAAVDDSGQKSMQQQKIDGGNYAVLDKKMGTPSPVHSEQERKDVVISNAQTTCMTLRSLTRRRLSSRNEDEYRAEIGFSKSPKRNPEKSSSPEKKGKEKNETHSGEQFEISDKNIQIVTGVRDSENVEENMRDYLVCLPEDKVKMVLETANDRASEYASAVEDVKSKLCGKYCTETSQHLRISTEQRKRIRILSFSSEDSLEVAIDGVEDSLEATAGVPESNSSQEVPLAEPTVTREKGTDEAVCREGIENQITSKADEVLILSATGGKNLVSADILKKPDCFKSSLESNTEESSTAKSFKISNVKGSGISLVTEKPRIVHTFQTGNRTQNLVSYENELKNLDSLLEIPPGSKAKATSVIAGNEQIVTELAKEKVAEKEVQEISGGREDGHKSVGYSQIVCGNYNQDGVKQKKRSSQDSRKTKTENIKPFGTECSSGDSSNEDQLVIVTDEYPSPSFSTNIDSDKNCASSINKTLEKVSTARTAAKKPVNKVKSEMYKKMHKRLAVQTSCLKELGRIQIRKPTVSEQDDKDSSMDTVQIATQKEFKRKTVVKIVSSLREKKDAEQKPSISQRKRTAVMLPTPGDISKKPKNLGTANHRHNQTRVSKVPVASDEAAAMCLFDQAVSETSYDDKLLEIVQKFQTPPISALSCDKLAECCVKFINKLDVGNMWHSVVLTVRYWSDEPRSQSVPGKILELNQVASTKERNFIEVLHQLSGEERWSDIISCFLRKMIAVVMQTRLVSVAQHGLNVRCILICARILLQDNPGNEISESVISVLIHLIENNSSDKVVPMVCFAVAIVPELVDELLLQQNVQYEPVRRVLSVHLASREELFTIFNKVIMTRLNENMYSPTCLQKLDHDTFQIWFKEAISAVVADINGFDLESMELTSRLSSAIVTCHALYNIATSRLFPDKETMAFTILDESIRMIHRYVHLEEQDEAKIFADTSGSQTGAKNDLIRTVIRLLLFGRLIASLIKNTECCILSQISNLAEEIYRLYEVVRLKIDQEEESFENRLLYFGLNDWLRVMEPSTKYLQVASNSGKGGKQ